MEINHFLLSFLIFYLISIVTSQTVNTCTPNTLNGTNAPDADDCNFYHVCFNGEFAGQPRKCGTTAPNFDVLKSACAANAVCFQDYNPDCTKILGRDRLPSKDNCRQYYDCTNAGSLETCPQNTPFFNLITSSCQADSENVICYPMSSKDETNVPTEDPEVTTTLEPGLINTCQPNTNYTEPLPYPSTAECSIYVKCENGAISSNGTCPNGWTFDYIYLSCIANGRCFPGETISCTNHDPEQLLVPHPRYCRQYYDCSSKNVEYHKVGKACQEPKPFFDYRQNQCVAEKDALCYPGSSKEIPPPPDKLNFYYRSL